MFFNYSGDIILPKNTENGSSINGKYLHSSVIGLILYQQKTHFNINIENTVISNLSSVNGSMITLLYSQNSITNMSMQNCAINKTKTTGLSTIHITYMNRTEDNKSNALSKFNISSCQFFHNDAVSVFRMNNILSNNTEMWMTNNTFTNNNAKQLFHTSTVSPYLSGYTKFINNTASIILVVTNYLTLDDNSHLLFHINRPSQKYTLQNKYVVKTDRQSSRLCIFQIKDMVIANNYYIL